MVEATVRRVRVWFWRHWATVLFVFAALTVLGCVTWDATYLRMVTWETGADYWEHSASLHSLIENPWHPRHPHLNLTTGAPRFGPQFLLVALMARALHWNPIQAMSAVSILNALLFLSGIYLFFRSYFRHPLAPLYAVLVMFGGWWHAFHYSNAYSLPVLLAVASFPSTTALGLTLLGFTLVLRVLRHQVERKWLALLLIGVWAAAIFIIHPLTAMMSFAGAFLLPLSDSKVTWRLRFEIAGAVVLGCALSHFWPYFSPWVVLRGGHGQLSNWAGESVQQAADLQVKRRLHPFYEPRGLLATLGLAVIPLCLLPYFFLRRERWFVGLGALGMLLPFAANAFVQIPLGHRFVLLAIFFLHVGLVSLLLRLTPGHLDTFRWFRGRVMGVISMLVIFGTLIFFCDHTLHMVSARFGHPRYAGGRVSPVIVSNRAYASATGPDAVVLANATLSWPLPTFGPKVLALLHDDPLVADLAERDVTVKVFLAPDATEKERRSIIRRYGVTHVLVQRPPASLARFLEKFGTVQAFPNGVRLYVLRRRPASAAN